MLKQKDKSLNDLQMSLNTAIDNEVKRRLSERERVSAKQFINYIYIYIYIYVYKYVMFQLRNYSYFWYVG